MGELSLVLKMFYILNVMIDNVNEQKRYTSLEQRIREIDEIG